MTPTAGSGGKARLLLGLGLTAAVFLFGVRLLGTATGAAAPALGIVFNRFVSGHPSALGIGWLAAYGVMNGSVVAAVAVSLFASAVVTPVELFLLVAGSRLGSAAIVVILGAADFLHRQKQSLPEATSLGVLAFLVTLSVSLPATAIGYVGLQTTPVPPPFRRSLVGSGRSMEFADASTNAITASLGPLPTVLAAIGVLYGCLWFFDRLLGRLDTGAVRETLLSRFGNPWVALFTGFVVTGLSTSVAFSLGVVVPLYNRSFLRREEVLPYVLGANVGTLIDTMLVAVVLGSPRGVWVVAWFLGATSLVTVGVMLRFPGYRDAIGYRLETLQTDRRWFLVFLALLVLTPLLLFAAG